MKKYILGTLLIATLAIVGGLKFFGNENVAQATVTCHSATQEGYASGCTCNGIVYGVGQQTSYTSTGQANCCGSNGYEVACGSAVVTSPATGGASIQSGAGCSYGGGTYLTGSYVYTHPLGYNMFCCSNGSFASNCGSGAAIGGSVGGVAPSLSGNTPTLSWTPSVGATSYDLQIATDQAFSNIIVDKKALSGNTFKVEDSVALKASTTYYWRVLAANAYGKSAYSQIFSFKTGVAAVGAKTAIVSDGSVSEDIYSLIATLGKWTDKAGRMVNPKSVTKAWVDENDQRVYPVVGPENAVNFISSLVSSRNGATGDSASRQLPACGPSNYNTTSQGFTCCSTGWVWLYTGSASVCSGSGGGAAISASSTANI